MEEEQETHRELACSSSEKTAFRFMDMIEI